MRYHHSALIGNQGDLVKHAALVRCIGALAQHGRDFLYLESHAAYPAYELQDGGRWAGGIGVVDWANPPAALRHLRSVIGARTFITSGDQYFGSHALARLAAEWAGANLIGWGCDILADSVNPTDEFHQGAWSIHLEDGLSAIIRAIRAGVRPDFVLLDPIFVHEDGVAIVSAVQHLLAADVPFLLWMARVADRTYGLPCDVRYELVFDQLAALAPSFTVEHPSPGSTTGMQLVCAPCVAGIVEDVVGAVRPLIAR